MPYKRRFPTYAPEMVDKVNVVRLVYASEQHSDQAVYTDIGAMFQSEVIRTVPVDGGPIVSATVNYFSFERDTVLAVGEYIIDGAGTRWLIKNVVGAGIGGGRVLAMVEVAT